MSKRFWTALLGGTLFGMLFARKSGKEMRTELAESVKQEGLTGSLKKIGTELEAMGEEFVDVLHEVQDNPTVQQAESTVRTHARRIARSAKQQTTRTLKKLNRSKNQGKRS